MTTMAAYLDFVARTLGQLPAVAEDLVSDKARLSQGPAAQGFLWGIGPTGTWLFTLDHSAQLCWAAAIIRSEDQHRWYLWTGETLVAIPRANLPALLASFVEPSEDTSLALLVDDLVRTDHGIRVVTHDRTGAEDWSIAQHTQPCALGANDHPAHRHGGPSQVTALRLRRPAGRPCVIPLLQHQDLTL